MPPFRLLLLAALWMTAAAQRTVSAAAVKRQLLTAVEAGDRVSLNEAATTLEQVLVTAASRVVSMLTAAQGHLPILTREFFDVAVGGLWLLKHSSSPTRPEPGM